MKIIFNEDIGKLSSYSFNNLESLETVIMNDVDIIENKTFNNCHKFIAYYNTGLI